MDNGQISKTFTTFKIEVGIVGTNQLQPNQGNRQKQSPEPDGLIKESHGTFKDTILTFLKIYLPLKGEMGNLRGRNAIQNILECIISTLI